MTTITQYLAKININACGVDEATKSLAVRGSFGKISEVLWGIAIFGLFSILGPFSAIAAICSVISSAKQGDVAEPEALAR